MYIYKSTTTYFKLPVDHIVISARATLFFYYLNISPYFCNYIYHNYNT